MQQTYSYPTFPLYLTGIMDYEALPNPQFTFPAFDVSQSDCAVPFLNAFTQTQRQCKWMDLNVNIPSITIHQPFASIFNNQILPYDISNGQLDTTNNQNEILKDSKMIDEKINQSSLSEIAHQGQFYYSILSNYEALFAVRQNYYQTRPSWQPTPNQLSWSSLSYYYPKTQFHTLETESRMQLYSAISQTISDKELIKQMIKMLLNVQGIIFRLDYSKMIWILNDSNIRCEHAYKSSAKEHFAKILELSSMRAQLQFFINDAKKRPLRKVYFNIAQKIRQILLAMDATILEGSEVNQCNIVQFVINIETIYLQINLLHNLMFANSLSLLQGNFDFMQFDNTFLNSQNQVFIRVKKLMEYQHCNRNIFNQHHKSIFYGIVELLFTSIFVPIVSLLNKLLFEQINEQNPFTHIQQMYLKHYFSSPELIITLFNHKLTQIKNQDQFLFLICKMHTPLKLPKSALQYQRYKNLWKQLFQNKIRLLNQIKKKHILQKEQKRNNKILQQKTKREISMKRINQKKEKIKKQMLIAKNQQIRYNEELKQQIKNRAQQKRLIGMIEKQKQKGNLLGNIMKTKIDLMKQKQILSNFQIQFKPIQMKNINKQISLKIIDVQQKIKENILEITNKIQIQQTDNKANQINKDRNHFEQQKNIRNQKKLASSIEQKNQHVTSILAQKQKNFQSLKKQPKNIQYVHQSSIHNIAEKIDFNCEKQIYKAYYMFLGHLEQECQEVSFQQSMEQEQIQTNIVAHQTYDPSSFLQICIDSILRQQQKIIKSSIEFVVFQKYQFEAVINKLKDVLFSGNGAFFEQFMSAAINNNSSFNTSCFNQCMLFDLIQCPLKLLQPSFYFLRDTIQLNVISDNIQEYVRFYFKKLPPIMSSYFNPMHLMKYTQIFSFILSIRHCSSITREALKSLNGIKKQILRYQPQRILLLKKIFKCRNIVQTFLALFQNYLFYGVIQKQFKRFKKEMKLDLLAENHMKMLDNIIVKGYIGGMNTAKGLKKLLIIVKELKTTIDNFIADDIPVYMQQEIQRQIEFIEMTFMRNQKFFKGLQQRI